MWINIRLLEWLGVNKYKMFRKLALKVYIWKNFDQKIS